MSGYRGARVAYLGLLFALSMVLSVLESGLSGFVPIPGIKLGLSNIVTMYCLFYLGNKQACTLATLKAFFVLATRGVVGAAMSLTGGLLSVMVMALLLTPKKRRFGPQFVSVCGGVAHNVGQVGMAAVILQDTQVFYYLPVLIPAGVAMGLLTGLVLRYLTPHLNRLFF